MPITQITDHADRAVDRLHQRHRDKVNIEALLRLIVDPVQDIEDAFWGLLVDRYISTAADETLNILGRIVGQARDGLVDADYRRYIRARIAANKSKGKWSDLIIVTRLILDDATATLVMSETEHMTVLMEITAMTVSDDLAAIVIGFLRQTKSDVVRLLLTYGAHRAGESYTLAAKTLLTDNPSLLLGSTTIEASDTTDFEASGSLVLATGTVSMETVTYTSKDATHFYGVSATTNTHGVNTTIHSGGSTLLGLGNGATPTTGGKFASVLT